MKARRIAFFDVDETLIDLKSMFSFRAFYFRRLWGAERGNEAEAACAKRIDEYVRKGFDRSAINRLFYEDFRDHQPALVADAALAWYVQERTRSGFFILPVLQALQKHQSNADIVAFVSGSAVEFLTPLATELGVTHVLANRMETRDGRFTGQLIPPQTIGLGKQQAALRLMDRLNVDPADCYGYGDHLTDLPLLMSIGNPIVVAGDPALLRHAEQLDWPILYPGASLHRGEA
ncbi:HAD family hydrolase [Pseudomonas chlororaphis]|uniref:HAD-superfamily hydrolase n=1 Tax=Pseudomonas chlororaphis TaxID=587753 RepID=A0AAX3FPX5_9PSED|nr:HAD family phosphatase [Pseudomonas chlororaphis]AZC38137.1 Phosphoserine phosphatase [Pseudomonas chlororaphis subsp. piscium]AZC44683.1 Phosphoserine phosphatase [Pseudomonas chlororaphis subsp. piscium]AZC76624.1 Phosphoserine phosphatase [Pseudomonas chlororaphis subsp. piscium]WDG70297.1 HAD family phosphatase [Pseudomonas chlororaphis]WDH31917.1 HAD family phosphatase [Pseudomonas chlororaphis]